MWYTWTEGWAVDMVYLDRGVAVDECGITWTEGWRWTWYTWTEGYSGGGPMVSCWTEGGGGSAWLLDRGVAGDMVYLDRGGWGGIWFNVCIIHKGGNMMYTHGHRGVKCY
ncbi:unnamed protein product [Staurois parvus]|uniref:Uncharacterized protein n=1 Tax=Staurois parvus TaxID=386267 RepID=A0ABN9BKV3_9NEOB|nr:unnamed protein product [Staurois parvus]